MQNKVLYVICLEEGSLLLIQVKCLRMEGSSVSNAVTLGVTQAYIRTAILHVVSKPQ